MQLQKQTIVDIIKNHEYSKKQGIQLENNKKSKVTWNYVIRQALECSYSLLDCKQNQTKESLPCVVICLENCLEEFEICYGCHLASLIPLVLSPRMSFEQIQAVVSENNVVMCFIDNYQKYKFERLVETHIPKILVGVTRTITHIFKTYQQFLQRSNETAEEKEAKRVCINELIESTEPDDICEIVIVPDDDGGLKRLFWTHRNIITQCTTLNTLYQFRETERYIHYYPNYFFIERLFSMYLGLYHQFNIYIGSVDLQRGKAHELFHLMKNVKPTLFLGVPRMYEKIVGYLKQKQGSRQRWAKKKIYAATVQKLEEGTRRKGMKTAKSLQKKSKKRIGIFSVRHFFNAVTPINRPLMCELLAYGIGVNDGLCLPETTGYCTVNREQHYLMESLGTSIHPDVHVTLDNDSITVEGPLVALSDDHDKQPVQTKIRTPFTGEIQHHHDEDYIKRTGTSLPLLTTSTGQIVYPLPIEKKLNEMKTINASLVVGENKKFLSCILFTSMDAVKAELEENTPTRQNVSKDPYYASYLKKQLEIVNRDLSKATRLKRFVVIVDKEQQSLFIDNQQRLSILQQYEDYYTMIYKY